ncbi:MAG: zinc ribbon domain-containing protein [Verrucomicrobiota bacterium]
MGRPAPETCANCGADIHRHARACPECGADERTGWRETDTYDGLDLPDSAWEDEDNATTANRHRALGRLQSRNAPGRDPDTGLPWYWTAVALALLLGAILYVTGLL